MKVISQYKLYRRSFKRFGSDRFSPGKFFYLFGSLHIENLILRLCGSLIEESGLDKIMPSCGLFIIGTDSLISVTHIKRARCCIQVAACVMFSLLTSAYQVSGSIGPVLQWLKNQSEESEICHYRYIIIDSMLNLLNFIRSIRKGNFGLYVYPQSKSWNSIMPVIITIVLAGWRSTYMIWLTYYQHHRTCTNVFRWPFCFSKIKQKIFIDGDWLGSWAE